MRQGDKSVEHFCKFSDNISENLVIFKLKFEELGRIEQAKCGIKSVPDVRTKCTTNYLQAKVAQQNK